MLRPLSLPLLALLALPLLAHAQDSAGRLPRTTITGSILNENLPVDETNRPDWTSQRRFPTTRVYLQQAPYEVGFEQWVRHRDYRDGTSQTRFQEEVELGLPYRMQLDIYETWMANEHRRANQEEVSFELRFALADWGKIPLNPTLYVEYALGNKGPNVLETKLLLGDAIMPRLHWGFNVSFEHELQGELESEFLIANGLSYTCIDQLLSVGVEFEYIRTTSHGGRDNPEEEFNLGPSVQIRPTKNTHLDLVGLVGLSKESPNVEFFAVFGIDFGRFAGHEEKKGYEPVTLRGGR